MNTKPERKIIKVPDGKICDYIDDKFRRDTPEEYVRQTIEKRLVNEHKYKREQIKIEFGLKLGSRRPRADIVIFSKDSPELTQDHVWLIVECKSERIEPKHNKDGVEMINPKPDEKICDTSCGTGGFLVMAMNHVIERLKTEVEKDFGKPEGEWSDHEKSLFRDRIKQIAASNFYGFDINPDLVKATKMNMVMNNDGSGNIYRNNSLLPPHEWPLDLKKQLADALNIEADSIKNADTIEFFDVIVTNPPFVSKIPIKDSHILEQFDIGYLWRTKRDKNGITSWTRSSDFQSSAPPEQLFIERCLQFLKPGGRLAIVLPDSILGNPGLGYIRQWLIEKTKIIASVDLHVDTFQPRNGTQTSVLIVQKKTQEETAAEQRSGEIRLYNIFMAMVERVGHDKRGNTLFKRDEYGNELWEPEKTNVLEIDRTSKGDVTYQPESKTRTIDDQTCDVPPVFTDWKQREGIVW